MAGLAGVEMITIWYLSVNEPCKTMSIQGIRSRIHQLVDACEDETELTYILYVVNQLLAKQPDYAFLDDKTLDQLVYVSALVDANYPGEEINSSILKSKIRERFPTVDTL